jgi:hypothetical protein
MGLNARSADCDALLRGVNAIYFPCPDFVNVEPGCISKSRFQLSQRLSERGFAYQDFVDIQSALLLQATNTAASTCTFGRDQGMVWSLDFVDNQ